MAEMAETNPEALAEAKEKMRDALERKKAQERRGMQSRGNTGAVHGSQVSGAEGRRSFRRKSG